MPTALIQPKKRGSRLKKLSTSEAVFIRELLGSDLWKPTQAARKAGYKNPNTAARQLMMRPHIASALGKEQRRRLERLDLRADEVLNVLATGLFFNPLSLFHPTKNGGWAIEDLDKVPDEIGRCVRRIKVKTVESLDEEGNTLITTYFELELLDKTKLLEMAMKHCGVDGTTKVEHSGEVGIGMSEGLDVLLMDVERTRSSQVIDGKVIDVKVEE